MRIKFTTVPVLTIATVFAVCAPAAFADDQPTRPYVGPNLAIVPQIGIVSSEHGHRLELQRVAADVDIHSTTATTTLQVTVRNQSNQAARPVLMVPLPPRADLPTKVSSAGSFIISGDHASKLMRNWVAATRNPALLEFAGADWLKLSIAPIPSGATKTYRMEYRQPLTNSAGRSDYVLPRSQLLSYEVPWMVSVRIRGQKPISTVYSPSHNLSVERVSSNQLTARIVKSSAREPGPFRLSCLYDTGTIAATLFISPGRANGDGYFLMLIGPPADPAKTIKREITFVIDRSASMKGKRLDQVRSSVTRIVDEMVPGETLNILQYNDQVQTFSRSPVANTSSTIADSKRYLNDITPRGGTNTYDALKTSLSQKPSAGKLPIVLFFTDGLPTTGNTSETAIRDLVVKSNPHNRRVYTVGVGVDIKTTLLGGIAAASRGRATFVLPSENVVEKIAPVVDRLKRPVLSDVEFDVRASDGKVTPSRVHGLQPSVLPDLFYGDSLVVLGRYQGAGPIAFRLRGNYLGKPTTFPFRFDMRPATAQNDFVRRLWASRKIASLVDEIRQSGASALPSYARPKNQINRDVTSRVGEILKLTAIHGVLTEYTAFAGRAPENWSQRKNLMAQAIGNLNRRAVQTRAGFAAVNQEVNGIEGKGQQQLNYRNTFYNSEMQKVAFQTVQQIGPDSFFRQNGVWVDGQFFTRPSVPKPRRVLAFGSESFFKLLETLTKAGRQGALALPGNVLLLVQGEAVLVTGAKRREK